MFGSAMIDSLVQQLVELVSSELTTIIACPSSVLKGWVQTGPNWYCNQSHLEPSRSHNFDNALAICPWTPIKKVGEGRGWKNQKINNVQSLELSVGSHFYVFICLTYHGLSSRINKHVCGCLGNKKNTDWSKLLNYY